jgi:hypothetical protein
MFPLGDQNRHGHITPVVNYVLIAINVAVFFYQISLGSENAIQQFINTYGVIPQEIVARQDIYTLFTSMFMHGGWAHIIGNMLFLMVFGDNVEDAFGHLGYLAFYLVTGLAVRAHSAQHRLTDSERGREWRDLRHPGRVHHLLRWQRDPGAGRLLHYRGSRVDDDRAVGCPTIPRHLRLGRQHRANHRRRGLRRSCGRILGWSHHRGHVARLCGTT